MFSLTWVIYLLFTISFIYLIKNFWLINANLYNNCIKLKINKHYFINKSLYYKDLKKKLKLDNNFLIFKKLLKQYLILSFDYIVFLKKTEESTRSLLWDFYLEKNFDDFMYNEFEESSYIYDLENLKKFNTMAYDYYYLYYYSWYNLDLYISSFYFFMENFQEHFKLQNLFFYNFYKVYKNKTVIFNKYIFIILTPLYYLLKTIIIPVFVVIIFFFIFIFYFYINILKQLAVWLIIGFLFFWLISGFNFFLKRGLFGKLTSALLRFWKRTNTYFWLVEGFLFLLFFYYYLNSSQEPVYMYDFSSLNQSYLPNLWIMYCNTFILLIAIVYLYFWILNISGFTFQQNVFHVFFITLIFIYLFFIESYQFYYVITVFFENFWFYNQEQNIWVLEFESPRLRVKQQYLILALIAKYWHFIFIFLSWVFFIIKFFEQKRSYYTHTGFNLQNLIILFWLNFLFIIQWAKWVSRRFLDSIYYWFFTDSNFYFFKYFFYELI